MRATGYWLLATGYWLMADSYSLSAQAVLTGTIRADSSGTPLAGVEVLLVGSSLRTVTDPRGRYSFGALPRGQRLMLFRSVGFHPVRETVVIGERDTVWVNAMLIPATVRLDPIEVRAQPDLPRGLGIEAFEERRRLGFGEFFDSLEIRRFENHTVADFLSRVGGSARRAGPAGEQCHAAIYIDGIYRGGGGAPTGPAARPQPNLKDEVDMVHLAAIEVYRSAAQVPPEYGGATGACGVILLWTRRN